jgi:CheY-like chemotaxis protein
MPVTKHLQGLRILIIEDEALISMMTEDMLSDFGCKSVGVATNVKEALEQAAHIACDAVVMDVNLHGEQTFVVARLLSQKRIPYIFTTGYTADSIPEDLRHVPILQKPFQERDFAETLGAAVRDYAA